MLLRERPEAALADDALENADRSSGNIDPEQRWLVFGTAFFALAVAVSFALVRLAYTGTVPYELLLVVAGAVGVGIAVLGVQRLPVTAISTLTLWAGSALMTVLVFYYAHAGKNRLGRALILAALLVIPLALAYVIRRWRAGVPWRSAVSELTLVFTMPKTGWPAALLGVCAGLPVIGTYAPVLNDPDSSWLVISDLHLREDGVGILTETQNVFLPHLTIGPLVAVGGYGAAVLFAIGSTLALCGVTSYLGYKMTDTGVGALVATLVLLSLRALPPASRLPLYPLTFIFGYGAAWLLHRAMGDPNRSKLLPVAAGVGFVLAYEAHGIGQLFLLAPFLLLLLHKWSRARLPLAITLGTIAVFSIPRVLVNLAEGGLNAFRSNYTDFMTQKYLDIVNRDLWGYDVDESPWEYAKGLPEMVLNAIGGRGLFILLMIPVLFVTTRADWRSRTFVVVSTLVFVLALTITSPSNLDRYLSPLAVGMALVVAIGVAAMFKESTTTTFGWLFVGGLLFMTIARTTTMVEFETVKAEGIERGPLANLAARIDDEKSVVGVRSPQIAYGDPDIRTENHRTMSEEDFVTFLTWPSDEEVAEMFDRNDIGWMVVIPNLVQEVQYHETWLRPVYGVRDNHVGGAIEGDLLCLAAEQDGYMLFRYGECEPGDVGSVPDDYQGGIYEGHRNRYVAGESDLD